MSIDRRDNGENEENTMICAAEDLELEEDGILVSQKCCRKPDPEQTLILNIRSSCIYATPSKFFFQNFHGLHNSIPKHITSFDEKYALRCLELIRKFAAWNIASKVDTLSSDESNLNESRNRSSCEMAGLAVESSSFAFGMDVVVNSSCGEWTFNPVTRSSSMIQIMKSPLLQRFGSLDNDVKDGKVSLHDDTEQVNSDLLVATNGINNKSSHKATVLNDKYVSESVHKRAVSTSSTNSSSSDQSSCSTSATMYQGMLTCAWKNGLPHYVYTVDDRPEVYVADLSKVESLDDKVLDYAYTFHSRKRGKQGNNTCEIYLEKVGTMRVYNSITVCSDNSDIIETRFVLSVSNHDHHGKIQTLNHTFKKNKMAKKVMDVFRSSRSYKHRTFYKNEAPPAILEDASSNRSREAQESFDQYEDSAENKHMQDIESAAIVVKDHVFGNSKVADLGGWGMKFLKKPGNNTSSEALMSSKCPKNSVQRSTSIDVLIPAGFHGGPRTINSGPSSLIQRWINGGCCDCGGWDIGCPLTILNTKSSCTDLSRLDDDSQECNSTDLFIQGSKQTMPIMKMVNIHDGLFYINFQSTLSVLQSFSIAAAITHSRSPVLQSKLHRS